MAVLKSINPYDPSRIVNYPQLSDMNLALRLGRAHSAFARYRQSSLMERAKCMNQTWRGDYQGDGQTHF